MQTMVRRFLLAEQVAGTDPPLMPSLHPRDIHSLTEGTLQNFIWCSEWTPEVAASVPL